jgi:hypothetical protein
VRHRVDPREAARDRVLRLPVGLGEQRRLAVAQEREPQHPGPRAARELRTDAVVRERHRVVRRRHHLLGAREGGRALVGADPQGAGRRRERHAAEVVRARPAPPVRGAEALDALVLRVERGDALVLARPRLRRPVRHAERRADGREGLPAVGRADRLVAPRRADDRLHEVEKTFAGGRLCG